MISLERFKQQVRNEGIQICIKKGSEKGIEKVVVSSFENGFDIGLILCITALSNLKINTI